MMLELHGYREDFVPRPRADFHGASSSQVAGHAVGELW